MSSPVEFNHELSDGNLAGPCEPSYGTLEGLPPLPGPGPALRAQIEKLQARLRAADPELPADLISQLEIANHDPIWIEAVILACDHVRFEKSQAQERAGALLLNWAERLADSPALTSENVVWSAILRGGSLISLDQLLLMEPLLEIRTVVDTRTAAMQAIVHIFEVESPCGDDVERRLVDRLLSLVVKHIDPDVLVPGEVAALAIEGLVAVELLRPTAVVRWMGDPQTSIPGWFRSQLERRLNAVLQSLQPTTIKLRGKITWEDVHRIASKLAQSPEPQKLPGERLPDFRQSVVNYREMSRGGEPAIAWQAEETGWLFPIETSGVIRTAALLCGVAVAIGLLIRGNVTTLDSESRP